MDRFDDFAVVHDGKGDYEEALAVLRESLGITNEILEIYRERIINLLGDSVDATLLAGALVGLIVGLIVSDYASEI